MKGYEASFVLTGEMPLLMHANDIEAGDELMEWRKAPENKNVSVPGDDRSPAWTWQSYLYQDGTNVVMSSDNLMACLRAAGAQIILKRQKTFKEITQSGLILPTEYLNFTMEGKKIPISKVLAVRNKPFKAQADAAREMGFRLWAKRARIGQAMHIRVRPRFEAWEVSGTIRVEAAQEITWEILQQLFELAGRVGLCDWRPGCKSPGSFGMFSAKLKRV